MGFLSLLVVYGGVLAGADCVLQEAGQCEGREGGKGIYAVTFRSGLATVFVS